jgi:glycosyltransferase involved in cell wall biosynthesis
MTFKILFVIESLGHGGAERSLAEMMPCLVRTGIQPVVAYFQKRQKSLEPFLAAQGATLHFLGQRGIVRDVLAVRRLIRAERPDVVHTALFRADLVGRLASIGTDTVVVSSLVNTNYDRIRLQNGDISAPKLWLVRQIDAWTARHLTTHLHAVSEPVKSAAMDALGISPTRITVIERGRSDRFSPPSAEDRARARQKLKLNDSDDVIVTVGRQVYQKGQRYLVEAMECVSRHRPRAILLMAGSPGGQSGLLTEIRERRNLAECVRFLGHRDDVPDLLAAADLFVFPSLYEGAAGSLLEAMAMGLPIVASRISAIENAVEEGRNALLVERMQSVPLGDAIVGLLDDPERARQFGCRSREIFEERFTIERCTSRMVEFYRRLAATNERPVRTHAASAACE